MEIDELLKYGESVVLECKLAAKEIPKSLWETYSSFANTNGGDIILGIKENIDAMADSDRYVVNGIPDPEKLLKDFWSIINSHKVSANLLVEDYFTNL